MDSHLERPTASSCLLSQKVDNFKASSTLRDNVDDDDGEIDNVFVSPQRPPEALIYPNFRQL
jgi:hypothetical protein